MDVAPDAAAAPAHDEHDLSVGLVPADAVDDVAARLLEPAGPADVRLLVEAREQLHEHGHLLAVLGRALERSHHRRVAARAIQRLLDREHVRIVGRPTDERHHRIEGLVGVVQHQIALVEQVEELRPLDVERGLRFERRVAQVLEGRDLDERGERPHVERASDAVDVLGSHLES